MKMRARVLALATSLVMTLALLGACTPAATTVQTQTESTPAPVTEVTTTLGETETTPPATESATVTESETEKATESATVTESETEKATESETVTESETEEPTESESEDTTESEDATESEDETSSEPSDSESEPVESRDTSEGMPLVYGTANLSEKFSTFFADTVYDREVADLTGVGLLTTDRQGNIIFNAIEGETHSYAGKDYEYTGIADLKIDRTDENTTYTFKLREDVKFSDGEPLTADDVIFTMYAFLDPTYVGSSTLQSLPIVGLRDYRTQTNTAVFAKYETIFNNVVEAKGAETVEDVTDE